MHRLATDIPVGRENAISREQLCKKWGCSDREMRKRIAELRTEDGDDYVIASTSSGGTEGYYRTDKVADIRAYMAETRSRAMNTLKPMKRANRVLRRIMAEDSGEEAA